MILYFSNFGLKLCKPSRRFSTSGSFVLFKGIHSAHPAYSNALKGLVLPPVNSSVIQDTVDRIDAAVEHNEGMRPSSGKKRGWTSWTHSELVAKIHAGENGVVVSAVFPQADVSLMWSPDEYFEQEVLVQGAVKAAEINLISPVTKE